MSIYEFYRNGDYLDSIKFVRTDKSNIDKIQYKDIKVGWFYTAFMRGLYIDTTLIPEIHFIYEQSNDEMFLETLLNADSLLLVNEQVRYEFEKCNVKNIQYIPIQLVNEKTKEVRNDYFAINILTMIDAIDLENSQYRYYEKYNSYTFPFEDITFSKEIIKDLDVFRDTKHVAAIYVSEKIKKIFEKNNWQSMSFRKMKVK